MFERRAKIWYPLPLQFPTRRVLLVTFVGAMGDKHGISKGQIVHALRKTGLPGDTSLAKEETPRLSVGQLYVRRRSSRRASACAEAHTADAAEVPMG